MNPKTQPLPVDAAAWLTQNAALRTPHRRFECLAGCGFCCTYPPEVQRETWEVLSRNSGLKTVGVDADGTLRLPLQGGCGACVLLKGRTCTDYEHRPKHCRLFPFHVYFGRGVEVYANAVCPGLDAHPTPAAGTAPAEAPWGSRPELSQGVTAATRTVDAQDLDQRRRSSLQVHAEFERKARKAEVWADVDEARTRLLPGAHITDDAWTIVMASFDARDEVLPTMVLPGPAFEWRTWRLRKDRFERIRLEEDGGMATVGTIEAPVPPRAISPLARRVLARLAGYECFVGAAFDLVDASKYEMPVEAAVEHLLSEMAAGLALREPLLRAEGLPIDERWLAAAYEPEFYDLPTIGGWL